MKTTKIIQTKIGLILLTGTCFSFICGYSLYNTYKKSYQETIEEVQSIFQAVVRLDKNNRFSELNEPVSLFFPGKESPLSTPIVIESENGKIVIEKDSTYNPTSWEEWNYMADHILLLFENPIKINVLDSLFNNALKQKGYSTKTAVIYTTQNNIQYSNPDSTFYTSAVSLGKVHIIPSNTLVLEAFVKIPFINRIDKEKNTFLLIICIWLLGIILCIWIYRYKKKENITVLPLDSCSRTLREITDNLFFDEEQGFLIYGEQKMELKDLQLKLFTLLLNSPDYFQAYTEMKIHIWNNAETPQDTVNKTIIRLRKNLSSISCIQLESLRGKGCRLLIYQ